jgi:hypothetical protein
MPAISNIISPTVNSEEVVAGGVRLTLKVSARAKMMRLRVDPRTGNVLLTVPRRASKRKALEWAAGQSAWIEAAVAHVPQAVAIEPGSVVPLHGRPHLVDWRADRPRRVEATEGRIVVGGPAEGVEARVLRWLKAQARDVLEEETRALAARAERPVSRVSVADTVSRWGSCSSAGAISYSWRLILAPDFVRRATVAHEVAHLVHMNHGAEFHALAAALLGEDPAEARQWLRREGASLHRIGRQR